MAKVTIAVEDIAGSKTDFNIAVVCDPPLEAGKYPDTQAGKIAERIVAAMINYSMRKKET